MTNCSVTRHRAGLGDAADVVAAQVDQHQVFRDFLGVVQQLGLEREVFFPRMATPAGAGKRAVDDGAVLDPRQDFRR